MEYAAAAVAAIDKGSIIDGELVMVNTETGKPDFEATMVRFQSKRRFKDSAGLCFVAFDILAYRGKDTTSLPLMTRKVILQKARFRFWKELLYKVRRRQAILPFMPSKQ